jgi:hypothetical protein
MAIFMQKYIISKDYSTGQFLPEDGRTTETTQRHLRRLILLLDATYTATCFGHTTIK